eukprot:CAMPEP_0197193502 /NCGR_PEP_ID=MMETSP1423-20130617/27312_1 /TAXON_ID=476441 /ORGANISM="Pseudo-nitzschia heimii, Strain UNC1101" /LENGTH=181 /DNA_ID=CAMNT_0042646705 /DNA_START=167 /DNA_END=708 /DNA_ORIENTATION=-
MCAHDPGRCGVRCPPEVSRSQPRNDRVDDPLERVRIRVKVMTPGQGPVHVGLEELPHPRDLLGRERHAVDGLQQADRRLLLRDVLVHVLQLRLRQEQDARPAQARIVGESHPPTTVDDGGGPSLHDRSDRRFAYVLLSRKRRGGLRPSLDGFFEARVEGGGRRLPSLRPRLHERPEVPRDG